MIQLPNMTKRYDFKTYINAARSQNERFLQCPRCREVLTQLDIENFTRCPFCNYRFEFNAELEDFILEPVVENWIRQQGAVSGHFHDDELPNGL